jgi:hypothetical protein
MTDFFKVKCPIHKRTIVKKISLDDLLDTDKIYCKFCRIWIDQANYVLEGLR